MTIEKFITKCCSYGMHISEPCDLKLILNSLYGRKATAQIKEKNDEKKKRV